MNKLIQAMLLAGVMCVSVGVSAKTLQLNVNLDKQAFIDGQTLAAPKSLGMATLKNGVKLPAYDVPFHQGLDDAPAVAWSLSLDKSLDPALSKQFVVYFFEGETYLLPKDWQFVNAAVGADGSSVITFAPPQGQNGHFSAWSNGGCYGCGVGVASYFFKEADELNQEDYGAESQYLDINPKVQMTHVNPNTQAWQTVVNRQRIEGIVYFNLQEDAYTKTVQVSLPHAQSKLATPILNWHLQIVP